MASYTVVQSLKDVEEKIHEFEVETISSFTIYKRNKGFSTTDDLDLKAHRVYWEDSYNDEGKKMEMCDNCPFIVIGQEIRECHNGPDRNLKKKIQFKNEQEQSSQSDHNYNQKGRILIQNSKKMECPARIVVKRILRFPDFKIQIPTAWKKKETSKALRKVILDSDVNKVDEYHIMFPKNEEHKFHLQGEFAGLSLPVGDEVKAKIKELAGNGVTKVSEMKRHLKMHTKNLGIDVATPNRRYNPTDKDIRNHMDAFKRQFRFSKDDQVNLQTLVEKWREEHPEDNFFLRTCLSRPDDKSPDEQFMFVHQSHHQKRLLGLYGKEICLLDATYGTSKYDLPLFFICVNTNVGYINVATFIIANEKSDTIKEALEFIRHWNQEWEPPYFMTDNDASEIAALEEVFPSCQVYLCEFHREQAWDRWLKKHQNGCSESKDELLKMFRSLADSQILDEYYENVLQLTTHPLWQGNERLRNWFEPRWLGHKERWVRLFKENLFNIKVTTTNGLERQHLKLKKMYLADTSDKSLSNLLTIIIQRFNPDSYERYIQNNIRCLQGYRAYADFIPKFLHNRPKKFISHCLSRMPPAVTEIPQENFSRVGEREFNVQSVDTNNVYFINLGKPECSCFDFQKHHLPCKHMLAAIVLFPNLNWSDLPDNFTGASNFNLDPCIFVNCATSSNDAATSNMTLPSTRKSSKRSKCVELIKKLETSIYNINEDDLDSIYKKLEILEKEFKPLVPTEHGLPVRSIPAKKNKPRTTFRGNRNISLTEMNEVSSNFMDVKKSLFKLTNVEIDEIQVADSVQKIWKQTHESGYIVAKVNGTNITDTDIRSLNYNCWLTDLVIDAYLGCLSQWENDKGGNVYCIPQFTMTKILEGDCNFETTLRSVQLLKYNKLIGAYHQNRNHWTLLVVEPDEGSLYFYNSMGETEQQQMMILNNWRIFIENRIAGGQEEALNVEWNIRSKIHSKQNDSHSCGIYTLIFAERHLANTAMFSIGHGELQSSRRRIANKLMLFEVYLRDSCPCCGMEVLANQLKVNCMQCKRDFHRTPHCVGDQNIERVDFNCVQCQLLNTECQNMTCFGVEKKCTATVIKNTVKRKDTSSESNGEVMNKKSKLLDNRSPLEISLGILHDKEFCDLTCNTFIQSVSCLDWSISWDSVVDTFEKLKSSLPKIQDTLISKVTTQSLGHFGDGYIDLIPKKFINNFQFPADLHISGTISLFTALSILWYGDDSHVHLLRLQTLVRQVLELGKMMTMNPLEIKDIKSEEITNLVATVKTRSLATKWSSDKSSGNKIAGISDNSASIDFICWSDGTKKFDLILKKDKTYEFTSVKVQKAKGSYCKSNHSFQIVLDGKTEIKEVNCDPLKPPLVIASISSLKNAEENVKINVIGKVIQLPNIDKLPSSGTPVIRARIQDNTGSIIYSLLGQETQKCNFSINDVLFLEGTEMKIYGSVRLLQGNKGERTVNPTNINCQNYLPSNDSSTSSVDLSPPKDMPVEKTAESLNKDEGRQKLTCSVQSCNLKDCIYDRCPRQSCRRRVIFLQQSNVYKCNECETEYLVTATGIRLILTITKEEKNSKKLILFNEMAENFIKTTAKKLSMKDEKDIENMIQEIMSSTYTFVASPKKGEMNEYLVESFLETTTCSEKANCSTVQEAPIEKKNQTLFRPYQLPEKTPEKGNISKFTLSETPSVESLPYQPLKLESPSTITDMSCFLSPQTRHFMASPSTSMSLPPYEPFKLHTPSGMEQTYTRSPYAFGSYEQSVRCLPRFKGIHESDANNNSNMLKEDNSHGSFNMSYMFDATVKPCDADVQNISEKADDKEEESTAGMTGVQKSYKFVKRRLDYD